MDRRELLKSLGKSGLFGGLLLLSGADAMAQGRGRGPDSRGDGPQGRGPDGRGPAGRGPDGWGPPGRGPASRSRWTKPQVQSKIRRLSSETSTLASRFETLVRRRKVEGRKAARLRANIRSLASAVNRLSARVNRESQWFNARSEMEGILRAAKDVQRPLRSEPEWKELVEQRWNIVRPLLNELAREFGLRELNERD